ncbi:hypothetical protein [Frigoriglobus tundricola]|uniref:Carboxypeptidase regulatory-like domain-containing protein n=1 Tax=Frigoriglobus tundricola TaxID=2774151 RepID=A0A6M5YT24_9BACT|nr:hypothetical protein [Frigoriglobus tundricola]QJW96576.1 hypothetical protein FTUN_4133 [Frigoriglobus tundricola]
MIARCLCLVAGFAALALSGCEAGGKPAAVAAGGTVTFNKTTPPVGALVVFHPTDATAEKRIGGKPFGKVKDDGTFVLTTYAEGDGAPPGEYGVTIDWRPSTRGTKDAKFSIGDAGASAGPSKLNAKYGNPQQPVLKATVTASGPNQFAFDVD